MASDMIQIGKSGTIAARSALELTAQNIANAHNPDYARRTLTLAEVTGTGSVAFYSSSALSGVRVDEIRRTDSIFLQNQARRTSGDLSRADAELAGLREAEAAVEQAGIYSAIIEFEAALAALKADPLNPALRTSVLEGGRTMAEGLQIADAALATAGEQTRFEAAANVEQVNLHAAELARLNSALVRSEPGTSAHVALLDRRDAHLRALAQNLDISVEYQSGGAVNVRLGDSAGPLLVSGSDATVLAMATASDGTLSFTLNGAPVVPASGALAGQAQALVSQRDAASELDALAATIIGTVNAAQANGVARDGSPGQAFFGGSGAADIAVVLADGSDLATAPAGAAANSRDPANLDALRDALANGGPASEADRILFELANRVRARSVTREALSTIAENAQLSLARESAVDLDAEATNLVRYQQAFEASGRVIQVAAEMFDTILGIR